MDLEELRAEIDRVDSIILERLAERQDIVMQVAQYKRAHGIQPLQYQRFADMLKQRVSDGAAHGLSPEMIQAIWTAIHDASVSSQEKIL